MSFLNRNIFSSKSSVTPMIDHWEMENHERVSFLEVIEWTNKKLAVEIGSRQLGSLQFLSKSFERLICFDIDGGVGERIKVNSVENVEFVEGDSSKSLPKYFEENEAAMKNVSFIHIDGNHSYEGALVDIENVVNLKIHNRVYVLIHDSFNPEVRKAIKNINYVENKYVHFVDYDFCPGILHSRDDIKNQIWGGFTLVVMEPFERTGPLELMNNFEYTYSALVKASPLYR